MKQFAHLLELLALTPSRNRKLEALVTYFRTTPDPDRGFALAILTGALSFKNVKPAVLREVLSGMRHRASDATAVLRPRHVTGALRDLMGRGPVGQRRRPSSMLKLRRSPVRAGC